MTLISLKDESPKNSHPSVVFYVLCEFAALYQAIEPSSVRRNFQPVVLSQQTSMPFDLIVIQHRINLASKK